MKKKAVKITFNIWGNYVGFVGRERVIDFGREFDAKVWLAGMLMSGKYELSGSSHFTEEDVEDYKKFV